MKVSALRTKESRIPLMIIASLLGIIASLVSEAILISRAVL